MSDETKTWAEVEGAQKELVYGLLLDQGGNLLAGMQRRNGQGLGGAGAMFTEQLTAIKAALGHLGYVRPEAPRIAVPTIVPPGRPSNRRRN